jgi:hypothetical protein
MMSLIEVSKDQGHRQLLAKPVPKIEKILLKVLKILAQQNRVS